MRPIVYIDESTIRPGKLKEVRAAAKRLTEFVEENMPRLISYGFCFDDNRQLMTVVALHPDSESLEFHIETGRAKFQEFSDLIDLSRIDVYGPVSESVVEQLEGKARMLGRGVVAVHEYYAGFSR